MRINIKLLAIIFALTLQSVTMWSATTSVYPVSLSYRQGPLLGSNPKPTKAPAHYRIPLIVVFDDDIQQLLVTALAEGEFAYYIYNESEEVITQGVLACSNNGYYNIDLGFCAYGTYSLVVSYNNHTYVGKFEVID